MFSWCTDTFPAPFKRCFAGAQSPLGLRCLFWTRYHEDVKAPLEILLCLKSWAVTPIPRPVNTWNDCDLSNCWDWLWISAAARRFHQRPSLTEVFMIAFRSFGLRRLWESNKLVTLRVSLSKLWWQCQRDKKCIMALQSLLPSKDIQIFQAITFERWATGKEGNILFERCFTPASTPTDGDLVFVSKSTWPVSLVPVHKGESLAGPIL